MTTHHDPSTSEAPASAPATQLTNPNQVTTMQQPLPLTEPLCLNAGLCLANNADAALRVSGDIDVMEQFAATLRVDLVLDASLVERLFQLWNGVIQLQVDEVSDWALSAKATLQWAPEVAPPELVSVGATVYASGDVAFFLSLQGVEAPLWFSEQLDLTRLTASSAPR
jgi:hypothetical protein